jgi:hypothetical protein
VQVGRVVVDAEQGGDRHGDADVNGPAAAFAHRLLDVSTGRVAAAEMPACRADQDRSAKTSARICSRVRGSSGCSVWIRRAAASKAMKKAAMSSADSRIRQDAMPSGSGTCVGTARPRERGQGVRQTLDEFAGQFDPDPSQRGGDPQLRGHD